MSPGPPNGPRPRLIQSISHAAELLREGRLVAIPTETVYGLAANALDREAVRQIFEAKGRPLFDPLIVHARDLERVRGLVADLPAEFEELARAFWPGPLTLLLPKSVQIDDLVTAGLPTVGLRAPAHSMARELLEKVDFPLAAPSANRFGRSSPTMAAHVLAEFSELDLAVLDGGPCRIGVESTVIGLQSGQPETTIIIHRPGAIDEEQIRQVLARSGSALRILRGRSLAAPGQQDRHYAPEIPLVIVPPEFSAECMGDLEKLSRHLGRRPGQIAELTLESDAHVAARYLYARLRRLSASGAELMIVRRPARGGADGLWEAIWDRLERAATLRL